MVTKQSLSSHQVVVKLLSSVPMICDLLRKMIKSEQAQYERDTEESKLLIEERQNL